MEPSPIGWTLIVVGASVAVYAYVVYPLVLAVLSRFKPASGTAPEPAGWPPISITVPVYNEEAVVRDLIESLLAIDYPEQRRQILIVSDASNDGTEAIVAEYAHRGVELLRMEDRVGKTAAENAAWQHLRGEIVINTDASIRIKPDAVKRLVAWFSDPAVGVASGRDISRAAGADFENVGEADYVGYEMWVRRLETRVDGIVGASGCLYAIRKDLHSYVLPEALSRDFASAMVAREHGYRAVSVDDALCLVPRAPSLEREYHRKVRTITHGIGTLLHHRHLMNPLRQGVFAWMLLSHKLCRWLVPWGGALAVLGLALLSISQPWARLALLLVGLAGIAAWVGWSWPESRRTPRVFSFPAFLAAGNIAAMHALLNVLRGRGYPIWEPTRRGAMQPG